MSPKPPPASVVGAVDSGVVDVELLELELPLPLLFELVGEGVGVNVKMKVEVTEDITRPEPKTTPVLMEVEKLRATLLLFVDWLLLPEAAGALVDPVFVFVFDPEFVFVG